MSYSTGAVRQIISITGWAIGVRVAFIYTHDYTHLVASIISQQSVRYFVVFSAILIFVILIFSVISSIAKSIMNKGGMSGIDRFLGMAFGTIRGVIIVVLIVIVGENTSLKEKSWWRQSQVIPSVNLWLKKAEQKLPAEVRSVIDIAKQQF
jgi:membrane protein required for colicin V production